MKLEKTTSLGLMASYCIAKKETYFTNFFTLNPLFNISSASSKMSILMPLVRRVLRLIMSKTRPGVPKKRQKLPDYFVKNYGEAKFSLETTF